MKSGLLILAVVAITTGMASAHMVGSPRPFPRIETKAQPTTSPSSVTSNPAGRVTTMETSRQPVPILLAARTSIALQSVDPDAALPTDTAPGKMTESAAKAAIEADGYKGVRILQRATDGGWRARALRGATEVGLSVDLRGNIAAD
jgi:hypothetical protein